jgi:hypothetical protein
MKPKSPPNDRLILGIILVISLFLRIKLIQNGGLFFFPDEDRYNTAREVVNLFEKNLKTEAFAKLTREADHLGFKVLGLFPAYMEYQWGENAKIPGIFFSLFSLANIFIVYLISKNFGDENQVAIFAAFLMATSNSGFYFSAHLLPYDTALTLGLLGVFFAGRNKPNILTSILVGLFAFLTFFTYNGYWTLSGLILVIQFSSFFKQREKVFFYGATTLASFVIPFILVFWVAGIFGNDLLQNYLSFSKTVHQGSFSEGGILPFSYLWESEGLVALIWLGLIGLAISQKKFVQKKSNLVGIIGLLIIYGSLFVFSVGLQKFVVYGRLVKQLIPFIGLVAAQGLPVLKQKISIGKVFQIALITLMIFLTGINFQKPLALQFPLDFAQEIQTNYPDMKIKSHQLSYEAPDSSTVGDYQLVFVKYIFPAPGDQPEIYGEILMRAEHPQKYKPFLFEGFSPENRARFLAQDITMKLIRIDN